MNFHLCKLQFVWAGSGTCLFIYSNCPFLANLRRCLPLKTEIWTMLPDPLPAQIPRWPKRRNASKVQRRMENESKWLEVVESGPCPVLSFQGVGNRSHVRIFPFCLSNHVCVGVAIIDILVLIYYLDNHLWNNESQSYDQILVPDKGNSE